MDKNEIRELFKTHGLMITAKEVWEVNGKPVILHSALERLSAHLGLVWDLPTIVRQTDNEVVVLVQATRKDGIKEWSFGEVKIGRVDGDGGNYKVKGKQPGYPFSMAEKRGKDRVIVKLAGLHGAYSEEEADDFNVRNADTGTSTGARGRAKGANDDNRDDRQDDRRDDRQEDRQEDRRDTPDHDGDKKPETDKPEMGGDEPEDVTTLRTAITKSRTTKAVTALMLKGETQAILSRLTPELRDDVRDFAKQRMVALGWPGKGSEDSQAT